MAELGIASSIIGLACLGVKLSKHLYHFGENAVNADHNINRIATNVTLFSSMLKHVGSVMTDTKSLHTPEAVETAKQIVRECEIVFEEIGKIIALSGSSAGDAKNLGSTGVTGLKRRMSVMNRVKFYFEQPKVDWLLAQLEYLKTTLSVLIQTLHLAVVAAKMDEQNKSIQEYRETINQERLHIETLIFARQLSVIILNQQQQQHAHGTDDFNGEKGTGRVSPANSETSVDGEMVKPKLLQQESDSSLTLVTRASGHLDFLDNAIPNKGNAFSSVTNKKHDQVIDLLLSRWTRLPDFTMEPSTKQRKGKDVEVHTLAESSGDESTVILDASRDVSPVKQGSGSSQTTKVQPGPSETIDREYTVVQSPPVAPKQVSDTLLGPPPNASVPRSSIRTPSPRLLRSQSSALASSSESSFNPQANSKISLSRAASVPESPQVHDIPSSVMSEVGSIYASPRPLTRTSSMSNPITQTASYPAPMPPIVSRDTTSTLDIINEGYANQPRPLSQITSPPAQPQQIPPQQAQIPRGQYQAHVSPASSTRSSFSEDDTQIPWRIRIGSRYWDFIDSNLNGPRTPDLPTEPLSWLFGHDHANTEITDTWVDEEAIIEKRYPYIRVQAARDLKTPDEIRWRIFSPLHYEEIRALVQRTNMLEHMRSQRPQAGPIQAQRARSNSDVRTHPFQPVPQPQSGYFSSPYQQAQPPSQSYQDNLPRSNSSISQWQQQQAPYTSANPTGSNPLHRPQTQQQPRTVSFGGTNEIPAQQPRGSMKSVISDRSPRSSQDFNNHSYPPPPQQQQQTPQNVYWTGQGPPVTSPGVMQYPPSAPPYPPYGSSPHGPPPGAGQWTYPPSNQSQQQQQRWDPQALPGRNDRDRNRESRSDSESDESSREREHERRRRDKKKHEKERKKRGRASAAAAGTLGGIGGLAALLEGLDGL